MRRRLSALVLMLLLVGVCCAVAFGAWATQVLPKWQFQRPGVLEVQTGDSLAAVAMRLAADHGLDHALYLRGLALLRGVSRKIQAGEYRIEQGLSLDQLLDRMVRGAVVQYPITLVEGWTFAQAVARVQAHPKVTADALGWSTQDWVRALDIQADHPEGWLFPDTYHLAKGTPDWVVLKRATERMQAILAQEWDARRKNLPLSSPYEALILASIIEKETAVAAERQQIAGVFVRRLQRGMRLQTDPTVIYGLGAEFDGDLRWRDLRTDGPYNTYLHSGLPPTPIALPGRESVHAALHPGDGDALYFVARGDGTHEFNATYAAHEEAVKHHQLGQPRGTGGSK